MTRRDFLKQALGAAAAAAFIGALDAELAAEDFPAWIDWDAQLSEQVAALYLEMTLKGLARQSQERTEYP